MNERQLVDFLERLGTNRYFLGESKKTQQYVHFFGEVSNQYIDKKLRKTCNKFANELDRLNLFTAQHFFVYPNSRVVDDHCQMALYPEVLHGPPKTEDYKHAKECERELYSILDSTKELYNSYRQLVKEKINL